MRSRPSRTAEIVAWMRAVEHARGPGARVLDDPFAARFLGAPWRAALPFGVAFDRLSEGLCSYIATRHRYLDDAIVAHLASTDGGGVLVLGAGYDARGWRLAGALAGRPLVEVDHPATQARKRAIARRLPEATGVVRLPADLASEHVASVLARVPLDGPVFVVLEGVSMYLSEAALGATLDAVAARFGVGTRLGLDVWFRTPERALLDAAAATVGVGLAVLGEPLKFALRPEDLPGWLASRGWLAADVAGPDALQARYLPGGRKLAPLFACAVAEAREARARP